MTNSIDLTGGSYSPSELISAIAQSNDPTVDLSSLENKADLTYAALVTIEARMTAIESKLASLPTNWTFH